MWQIAAHTGRVGRRAGVGAVHALRSHAALPLSPAAAASSTSLLSVASSSPLLLSAQPRRPFLTSLRIRAYKSALVSAPSESGLLSYSRALNDAGRPAEALEAISTLAPTLGLRQGSEVEAQWKRAMQMVQQQGGRQAAVAGQATGVSNDPALQAAAATAAAASGLPLRGSSASLPFHLARVPDPTPTSFTGNFGRYFKRVVAFNLHKIMFLVMLGGAGAALFYYQQPNSFAEWMIGPFSSPNKKKATIPTTRFSDVCGCDEAKAEVAEMVEYLKNPEKFSRLGGRMPKGVLLLGPPGTGKTLLARAIAGEAGVPFFSATGADFEEKFVGVGAARMRELFAEARKAQPAIIFIDEIDTVGGKRSELDNPKARLSLNQLLTELDGFSGSEGFLVIAATNYEERLDPALLRPGRFDKHVSVPLPDIKGRKEILDLYARQLKLSPSIDLRAIARGTAGMSGADLFHLLNSSALRASALNKPAVTNEDIEYSKDKLLMGAERTSAVNSEDIRRHIAYYESGKSLAALLTPDAEPLHKVTIIQRGSTLGRTQQLRESDDDKTSETYREMLARLDTRLGGRAAEELIYGPDGVTSNAARDLAQASRLARAMVTMFGFGERSGMVSHGNNPDFHRSVSGLTKEDIDHEVRRLLQESYERVQNKLKQNEQALHRIAKELLKHEVLSAEQIKKAMQAKIDAEE